MFLVRPQTGTVGDQPAMSQHNTTRTVPYDHINPNPEGVGA